MGCSGENGTLILSGASQPIFLVLCLWRMGGGIPKLFRPRPVEGPIDGGPMKLKVRNSKSKKAKMTGFRTRQKTAGGRKVNKRQRARHGKI